MHQYRATSCRGPPEEAPGHTSPPVEIHMCASFEEYKEVPEVISFDFKEDEVMWVASNISGAAGALGVEVI